MAQFKIGDVVRLKSGGIRMTVSEVVETEAGEQVSCVWTEYGEMFDGVRPQRLERGQFLSEMLCKSDASE